MKKRVLITGGAGFIGQHLAGTLVSRSEQHEIVIMDNFFTGSRDNLKTPSLSGCEAIRHDVCDPFHIEVDEIYHLACPASPVHYQRNPVRTIETAVLGTSNALRCARDVGAKIFIASTSEIYGDPIVHPQTENYNGNVSTLGPRACYDEGKRCAESLAISYMNQYGVDVRIARIFNTYGPGMQFNDGRVVSNFIHQALQDEPLTIYGDGSQTRSFCYVADLVKGILSYMEMDKKPDQEMVVNLGDPNERTIVDLATLVAEGVRAIGRPGLSRGTPFQIHAPVFKPLPKDDPVVRKPDISRAQEYFGFSPSFTLKEGLANTISNFHARMSKKEQALYT